MSPQDWLGALIWSPSVLIFVTSGEKSFIEHRALTNSAHRDLIY